MAQGVFADAAQTWNRRFEAPGYLFGTEPNAYLARHAGLFVPGSRALCVADGEGRNSVFLARRGVRVDAFDIAARGVEKARKLAAQAGVPVDYRVFDCDAVRWPQALYDGIAAIFIQFADPPMRARLFAAMAGALRPGGVLVLQGYTPQQLQYRTGGPPRVEHLYTEALLREQFRGLRIEELVSYEADLAEGTQHCGRSALIGLVARRP